MVFTRAAFFTVALSAALAVAAASVPPLSKTCVLGDNGREHCTYITSIDMSVRLLDKDYSQDVPCETDDYDCWCIMAVKYTNDVREKTGIPPLEVGSETMLKNVMDYAKVLADAGQLVHQDFSAANGEIGCGLFQGAENIAQTNVKGNIAQACIDDWENSPGRLANMLSTKNDFSAIGFRRAGETFDGRETVYCVQTFSSVSSDPRVSGSVDDSGCEAVSMSGASADTKTTEAPVETPAAVTSANEPATDGEVPSGIAVTNTPQGPVETPAATISAAEPSVGMNWEVPSPTEVTNTPEALVETPAAGASAFEPSMGGQVPFGSDATNTNEAPFETPAAATSAIQLATDGEVPSGIAQPSIPSMESGTVDDAPAEFPSFFPTRSEPTTTMPFEFPGPSEQSQTTPMMETGTESEGMGMEAEEKDAEEKDSNAEAEMEEMGKEAEKARKDAEKARKDAEKEAKKAEEEAEEAEEDTKKAEEKSKKQTRSELGSEQIDAVQTQAEAFISELTGTETEDQPMASDAEEPER